MNFEAVLNIILTAIFSGIGTSIGVYFANKHLIERVDKLLKGMKHDRIEGNK